MNKYIKPVLAALLLGASAASVNAIPAKKGLLTFTQADGSTVEVELTGDEFAHFYLTPDGYPLVERNGSLYFAGINSDGTIETTAHKAVNVSGRSAEVADFLGTVDKTLVPKALQARAEQSPLRRVAAQPVQGMSRAPKGPGLSPGSNFPVTGSPHVLVILVEYKDVSMTLKNAHDYFSRMMTERGFSDYGGTGSAIDFFEENSNGQFTPQIDVYGPVTLPQNRNYYGGNDYSGDDKNAAQMIADACAALDGEIDFSKYDTDGDGVIDNVFVFYAGRGEADGGGSDTVWPHAWFVYSGAGIRRSFDGVMLDRYACSNEYGSNRPDGVGTFIHEFSHVMGLPDLYSTNYSSAFTPGQWSALDYGPYNNNGCTPPLYSAFERYALGWIEPVIIDGPVTATLPSIGDNICGIIKTGKTNEFFLVENRQKTSWDKYIPGHGMLVWHIDYNSSVWSSNSVNNSSSHQYVDIEEADNAKNEYTRAGDAFPGTSMVRSFTDNTSPSMKTWAGKSLGLPITDIAETNGVITFNVAGGKAPDVLNTPVALAATEVELDAFTACWEAVAGAKYLLSVYTLDKSGNRIYVQYNRTNVGAVSSVRISGLDEDTQYFYNVRAINGFEISDESNEVAVTTLRLGIDSYAPEALPATGLSESRFTANWNELPEATSYMLTVCELTLGEPLTFIAGFDNSTFPAGWSATKYSFNALANRYGADKPAVLLNAGNYIETSDYGEIHTVEFWHRANSQAVGVITVSGLIGGTWTALSEHELEKEVGGATYTVELPVGVSAIRIGFDGTAGSLSLDDIKLSYGHDVVRTVIEPFDSYNVGNVCSYTVDNLESGKTYSYKVKATDGDRISKESVEIRVNMPGGNSGIASALPGDGAAVTVRGGNIVVDGVEASVPVLVYDIAGRTVATAYGPCELPVAAPGVYIVRVGAFTVKVFVV